MSVYAVKPELVGIYSSFHYSERSGDIVGMEVQIIPNPVGYSAMVQASEGAPAFPEVYRIAITSSGGFRLEIPQDSACGLMPGVYRGTITDTTLILHGPKPPGNEYHLPRGKSFWQ